MLMTLEEHAVDKLHALNLSYWIKDTAECLMLLLSPCFLHALLESVLLSGQQLLSSQMLLDVTLSCRSPQFC